MDGPRLMVYEVIEDRDADNRNYERLVPRDATVPEVVAWLREQGAVDRLCARCGSEGVISCQSFPCEHGGHTCGECEGRGRYLIPPLGLALSSTGQEGTE